MPSKRRPFRLAPHRSFRKLAPILFVLLVVVVISWGNPGTSTPMMVAELKIYDLLPAPSGQQHSLEFLDEVDLQKHFRPHSDFVSIDRAHRQGSYHTGCWIHVTDVTGQYTLLLKRGPQLVTCPNSWGLVGEHTYQNETPLQTVQRALVEELWGGGGSQHQTYYATNVAWVRNLTVHPVYFVRDYGPSQDNRIDRQITYLYEVRLRHTKDKVILYLDDEVADHQWIHLKEYQQWLQTDATTNHFKDFCHSTITRLGELALERLTTTTRLD